MSDISVKDLDQLCEQTFKLRDEIDQVEEMLKERKAKLEELNSVIIQHLVEFEKTSYDCPLGKVTMKNNFYVNSPKDPEKREQFLNYVKSKGERLEDFLQINAMKLKSFYKTELEIAEQEQRIDFKIPGLDEPYFKQSLSLKRK